MKFAYNAYGHKVGKSTGSTGTVWGQMGHFGVKWDIPGFNGKTVPVDPKSNVPVDPVVNSLKYMTLD